MKDRWSTVASVQSDDLDALVHQSRLIGDETKLVLRGGGNTSIKRDEVDFRGRGVRVLRIKGSGSDMRTIKRGDFPGVRLDDVLPLIERRRHVGRRHGGLPGQLPYGARISPAIHRNFAPCVRAGG